MGSSYISSAKLSLISYTPVDRSGSDIAKLKPTRPGARIKAYLCSAMSEQRFTDFAVLSIEGELSL